LALRGGAQSPDVGMENWASEYDRMCWNESNPAIRSPLFVPKGNWTEEDFERARQEPCYQVPRARRARIRTGVNMQFTRMTDLGHLRCRTRPHNYSSPASTADSRLAPLLPLSRSSLSSGSCPGGATHDWLCSYVWLAPQGLPQSYDPTVEDPWDGLRGEGGASYWGEDPLENIPGGTQGLKEQPNLRQLLQTLLVQVRANNETIDAIYVLTMLEALQQLKVPPTSPAHAWWARMLIGNPYDGAFCACVCAPTRACMRTHLLVKLSASDGLTCVNTRVRAHSYAPLGV